MQLKLSQFSDLHLLNFNHCQCVTSRAVDTVYVTITMSITNSLPSALRRISSKTGNETTHQWKYLEGINKISTMGMPVLLNHL